MQFHFKGRLKVIVVGLVALATLEVNLSQAHAEDAGTEAPAAAAPAEDAAGSAELPPDVMTDSQPNNSADVPEPTELEDTAAQEPTEAPEEKPAEEVTEAPKDSVQDELYSDGKGYVDLDESLAKYHGYEQHRPNFGLSIAGSNRALGSDQPVGATSGVASAVSMELEYQPASLQSIGVLGFGLSSAIYPIGQTESGQTNVSGLGVWSFGAQIRYQAKWFISQPVVPMVAWQVEQLFYKRNDNASGNFTLSGPAAGLWILLNMFEPSSAGALFVDTGISRSYLVAEWRDRVGNDDLLSIAGSAWFLGLRLEF